MSKYGLCLLCFTLVTLNGVANSITHMLEIFRNKLGMERDGTPENPSLLECGALKVGNHSPGDTASRSVTPGFTATPF